NLKIEARYSQKLPPFVEIKRGRSARQHKISTTPTSRAFMPSHPKRPAPARTANGSPADAGPASPAGESRPEEQRPPQPTQPRRPGEGLNITDLKDMSIQKLTQIAKDMTVAGATGMRKQELIFQILKAQTEQSGFIFSEGGLVGLPHGLGVARA